MLDDLLDLELLHPAAELAGLVDHLDFFLGPLGHLGRGLRLGVGLLLGEPGLALVVHLVFIRDHLLNLVDVRDELFLLLPRPLGEHLGQVLPVVDLLLRDLELEVELVHPGLIVECPGGGDPNEFLEGAVDHAIVPSLAEVAELGRVDILGPPGDLALLVHGGYERILVVVRQVEPEGARPQDVEGLRVVHLLRIFRGSQGNSGGIGGGPHPAEDVRLPFRNLGVQDVIQAFPLPFLLLEFRPETGGPDRQDERENDQDHDDDHRDPRVPPSPSQHKSLSVEEG